MKTPLTALLTRLRGAPWPVWIVVLLSTGTAIYQYPTYTPSPPLVPYVLGCGLLVLGFGVGARWAFVVCAATIWIFPLETAIGIKAPLHGSTLTVLHVVAMGLLTLSWRYYWEKPKPVDSGAA